MTRFRLLLLLGLCLSVSALSSCSVALDDGTSIVVFHSYAQGRSESIKYEKQMAREFRRNRRNPEIHHIYADLLNNDISTFVSEVWEKGLKDSVEVWNPDLIFLNDDPIMSSWFLHSNDVFSRVPVIFAGVNFVDEELLEDFPLMTGFREDMAIEENLNLAKKVYPDAGTVVIPLDDLPFDHNVRVRLRTQIGKSPLYDVHYCLPDYGEWRTNGPDTIAIHLVSMLDPASNIIGDRSWNRVDSLTSEFVRYAPKYAFLSTKKDVFSDFLPRCSGRPQFTALREGFCEEDHLFLCGCFTGLDIQISDLVKCGCKVLNGTSPGDMTVHAHARNFYLDYYAAKEAGFNPYASEWKDFEIIGAPFAATHIPLVIILVTIVLIAVLLFVLRPDSEKNRRALVNDEVRKNFLESQIKRKILHDNNIYIWRCDDGEFVFFPTFRKFVGMEKPTITFADFENECVHPEDRPKVEAIIANMLRSGEHKITLELTFNNGADWHWWDVYYESRSGSDKSGFGLMILADDAVSEEKAISRAASISSETFLKENFLANISHDIRTPLSAVTGFAQLLVDPDITPREADEYSTIIKNNSETLIRLIEDVAHRAETGDNELALKFEKIRISDLVYNCYISNKVLVPAGLEFVFEPYDTKSRIRVNADALRITQVLNNFLSNSFKFTREGQVKLGWLFDKDASEVEMYVEDTGIGITKEAFHILFRPYEKVKESVKGTGLGLSISKEIIEKHGGTIKAESEYGVGSRFSCRLPVITEE